MSSFPPDKGYDVDYSSQGESVGSAELRRTIGHQAVLKARRDLIYAAFSSVQLHILWILGTKKAF